MTNDTQRKLAEELVAEVANLFSIDDTHGTPVIFYEHKDVRRKIQSILALQAKGAQPAPDAVSVAEDISQYDATVDDFKTQDAAMRIQQYGDARVAEMESNMEKLIEERHRITEEYMKLKRERAPSCAGFFNVDGTIVQVRSLINGAINRLELTTVKNGVHYVEPQLSYEEALANTTPSGWQGNHEDMAFYAFRYALGRMTYAASDVAKYIIDNWRRFNSGHQLLIHEEIKDALDKGWAGHACDQSEWDKILALPAPHKGEGQ
jgi:hypothetical protein